MRPVDEVLLFGDFNLPGVKWATDDEFSTTYVPVEISGLTARIFLDRILPSGLYQLNWKVNKYDNVLDLVFISSHSDIIHRYPLSPICAGIGSDDYHDACEVELKGHFTSTCANGTNLRHLT